MAPASPTCRAVARAQMSATRETRSIAFLLLAEKFYGEIAPPARALLGVLQTTGNTPCCQTRMCMFMFITLSRTRMKHRCECQTGLTGGDATAQVRTGGPRTALDLPGEWCGFACKMGGSLIPYYHCITAIASCNRVPAICRFNDTCSAWSARRSIEHRHVH